MNEAAFAVMFPLSITVSLVVRIARDRHAPGVPKGLLGLVAVILQRDSQRANHVSEVVNSTTGIGNADLLEIQSETLSVSVEECDGPLRADVVIGEHIVAMGGVQLARAVEQIRLRIPFARGPEVVLPFRRHRRIDLP